MVAFALINLLMASDDLRPEESSAVIDRTAGKLAGQPRFVEYLHDHKGVINQKVFENNPTRISTFWGGLEQVSLTGITSLEVVQGLLLFVLSRDLDPYDAEHKSTTEFMDVVFRSEVRIIDALVRCENFAQCIHTINDFFRKTTRKDNNGRRQQESHHAERLDQVPSEYYGIDEQSRSAIEEEIKKRIGLLFVPGVSTLSVDKPYDMLQNLFHGIATINLGVVHAHGMKFYPLASFIHDLFHYHDLRDTHRDAITMLIKQRIGFKRQTTDTVVELALDQSFQEIMREY